MGPRPILAPIVNGDGISARPFHRSVAHHDGAPLGHSRFVLSGRKDVSMGEPLAREVGRGPRGSRRRPPGAEASASEGQ